MFWMLSSGDVGLLRTMIFVELIGIFNCFHLQCLPTNREF